MGSLYFTFEISKGKEKERAKFTWFHITGSTKLNIMEKWKSRTTWYFMKCSDTYSIIYHSYTWIYYNFLLLWHAKPTVSYSAEFGIMFIASVALFQRKHAQSFLSKCCMAEDLPGWIYRVKRSSTHSRLKVSNVCKVNNEISNKMASIVTPFLHKYFINPYGSTSILQTKCTEQSYQWPT